MVQSNKILLKNDKLTMLIGLALVVYLYLDTPVPSQLMLNNYYLFIVILISGYGFYYLVNNVNMFVGLLFALVSFQIIRKSLTPELKNIDKKLLYYDDMKSTADRVISSKLKKSNTLEQEMVNLMKQTKIKKEYPQISAKYKKKKKKIEGYSDL